VKAVLPAPPADVRKGLAFPIRHPELERLRLERKGHSPWAIFNQNGKAKPFRTSAAKPHETMTPDNFININPEIESALAANKPVVALESTVIAHGLPR